MRLSGPEACPIAERILAFRNDPSWRPWMANLAELLDEEGRVIDRVVVTFFAAPRSYTAEDVIEIACHGSPVILKHCLARSCASGARLAEPGEFTLRAFLNGRIDLPRAEAIRDLIDSTNLYQARVAAQQAEGSVSRRIAPAKAKLVELIALLEAGIDFAEDDVHIAPANEILNRIDAAQRAVKSLAASFAFGKLVHSGFTLAIVGRPNVGKSSLFNRLLEQDRAIVTEIPGTTRDLVSETAAIDGIPVKFVDTAGIRDGRDLVETLGIERSMRAMADADMTLVVIDLSRDPGEEDRRLIAKAQAQGRFLIVGNKSDLPKAAAPAGIDAAVSALTGEGIDGLRKRIIASFAPDGPAAPESGFITSIRHERLLKETLEALDHARVAVEMGIPHEMLLLDLYAALRPLDGITGATTADDILNRIFSTFCIGK